MFYKFTPLPLPRSNLWNLTAWKLHVSIPYDNVYKSFGQYNYMNQCWIIVNWTLSKEIPVSMESKYIILDPRKLFWNRCLQKDGHFVSASVWKRSCVSDVIINIAPVRIRNVLLIYKIREILCHKCDNDCPHFLIIYLFVINAKTFFINAIQQIACYQHYCIPWIVVYFRFPQWSHHFLLKCSSRARWVSHDLKILWKYASYEKNIQKLKFS